MVEPAENDVDALDAVARCLTSHDIKTPLHALAGSLELLSTGALGPLNRDSKDLVLEMIRARQSLEVMLDRLALASALWRTDQEAQHKNEISLRDCLARLPIAIEPDFVDQVTYGNREALATALRLTVTELLQADAETPADIANHTRSSWRIGSKKGVCPCSGNHQVTALLVASLLRSNGFGFEWNGAGEVWLTALA